MLRERRSRGEVPVNAEVAALPAADNPERDNLLADSIGVAMLVVLETLTPAERVAFVLHDLFNISFDDVSAEVKLTHPAEVKLTHLGEHGGFLSRLDVEPGAVSGDSRFEEAGSVHPADRARDRLVAQHGAAVSA
jgi:hypothetical protein